MELITYKKRNGEIIERIRTTGIPYKIGEVTSMGWLVLDIKYNFRGKFYSREKYNDLLDKSLRKSKKLMQFKRNFSTIYNNLNHILGFIILAKLLEKVLISMI